ncbi:MogA/MoaB family molybdenum cofactor biosynthesis protein [Deinococcus budaensis]|uniref:Molybdenum cofactor biosynthesis protein B n=1 Tax=Deinococcus budaensis TaxID=1665626 RepID=A0A7W8GH65_9DEIO|nr:molybdenum cofactor biosynthesis protein B [Deinococcus budaensis]MBB5235096.1 molybdenum cofactor biosynthesis protein B [Deinococcus budaensis]
MPDPTPPGAPTPSPTAQAPTAQAPASHRAAAPRTVRAAVLTVSDTRTEATDTSGGYLLAELRAAGHAVVGYRIVKDEALAIRAALGELLAGADVVISSGGTGITGRDVTVGVVESLLSKPLPGFGELFRMLSYREVGGAAMLSRAVGGLAGRSLLFALPGSLNAVQTGWTGLLRDELGHLAFEVARHGQPDTVPAGLTTSLSPGEVG